MRNNLKSAFKMEFSDLNHQNIPKFQLAWLAATIECEGSITFGCNIRGKNRDMLCISPFISVTNSDQLLLKEVKRLLDILSERSFGSKPRFSKQYDHGARPGFRNTHGYKTNKNCQNILLNGQATKLVLLPCLPYFKSYKRNNAAIILNFLTNRKKSLFIRDKLGRIIRKGYTKDEIKLVSIVKTHKKGLTYEEMIKCKNVIN